MNSSIQNSSPTKSRISVTSKSFKKKHSLTRSKIVENKKTTPIRQTLQMRTTRVFDNGYVETKTSPSKYNSLRIS